MSQSQSQSFFSQLDPSPSSSRSSISPAKPRKAEPFLSLQIANTASDDEASHCTCCAFHSAGDQTLTVWFINGKNVYQTVLSADQMAGRARILKIPSADFIAIVRDSFAAKVIKADKKGAKMEVSFSGRGGGATSATSTVKVDLEKRVEDANVCTLLLHFGASFDRLQQEVRDLTWKVEELRSERDALTTGQQMTHAVLANSRTGRLRKKPKIDPHMSVINPRSRVIKPPKGVVFEEEEE